MSNADLTTESWKSIPGYEGFYEASNLGKIRSVSRVVRTICHGEHTRTIAALTLKPSAQHSGHLVAAAFLGISNLEINHIDGDPANNRLENLEYVTHAENMRHASKILHSWPTGENHWMVKKWRT